MLDPPVSEAQAMVDLVRSMEIHGFGETAAHPFHIFGMHEVQKVLMADAVPARVDLEDAEHLLGTQQGIGGRSHSQVPTWASRWASFSRASLARSAFSTWTRSVMSRSTPRKPSNSPSSPRTGTEVLSR